MDHKPLRRISSPVLGIIGDFQSLQDFSDFFIWDGEDHLAVVQGAISPFPIAREDILAFLRFHGRAHPFRTGGSDDGSSFPAFARF